MKKPAKGVIGVGIILLTAAVGYLAYAHWLRKEPLPDGLIQANGRIEGDHVAVASKFSGRVSKLLAKEGDTVRANQVLVHMDDPQVQARVEQARQAVAAFEARLKAAKTDLDVFNKDVPLAIEQAKAGVTHARAVVATAEAKEKQDQRDAERFRYLYAKGTADKHHSEMADLALTVSSKELTSSRTALIQVEKQLAHARLGWEKIKAKEDNLGALKAQCKQAAAVLAEVESVLDDFHIVAPSAGTLTTRVADAGEVVTAGSPLFDLVDMDRLYLKVYVAENQVGRLRRGLPARIYTDTFPGRPFDAEVRYIASQAEFTPKEVQTPDERVKLVYAVKLYLVDNPDHCLTPGMPADAVIRFKEVAPWDKPRW